MQEKLHQFVQSKFFQWAILVLICLAAIVIGAETYPEVVARYGEEISLINNLILWAFVIEAILKMAQHGVRFWRYFRDPWNVFDFVIIAVCLLPFDAQYAAVLRLARLFRALRLVTALPKLQLLVNALLRSIPSMFYVGVMLFLVFYVYGVMGVFLFKDNDPVHFRNLQTSMLSLFRVVTQEDWTDVMYIQMYGSDVYQYDNTTDIQEIPSSRPLLGALFFCSFVFLGTMIMLNLFIGVILNSMTEAQEERDEQQARKAAEEGRLPEVEDDIDAIQNQFETIQKQFSELKLRLQLEQ